MPLKFLNFDLKPSNIGYRPEIDGIRAIAVLAVLFYHSDFRIFNVKLLPGGYLGVDIFLVISGYLISTIIFRSIDSNSFSFKNFFERRIKRILPALIVMLTAVFIYAWFFIYPKPFVEVSKSIISTILLNSNTLFSFTDSYTSEKSHYNPLIHTWSLSLEEQYYLIFPLLMVLVAMYTKVKREYILLLGLAVSLLASVLLGSRYPQSSFYLLHTRSWEFLAGGLLSSIDFKIPKIKKSLLHIFQTGGFLMMVCPLFLTDDANMNPFLSTIPVVLGSSLLILGLREQHFLFRLLSQKFLVITGLMSYSLYLWHQPVFAFTRVHLRRELSLEENFLSLIPIALLTVASFFFVEKPFRSPKFKFSKLLKLIVVFQATLISFSYAVIRMDGFIGRFPSAARQILNPEQLTIKPLFFKSVARIPRQENKPDLFLVGDSHAEAISEGVFGKLNTFVNFQFRFQPGCPFLPGFNVLEKGRSFRCDEEGHKKLYQEIGNTKNGIVIVMQRLQMYLSTSSFREDGSYPSSDRFFIYKDGKVANEDDVNTSVVATIKNLLAKNIRIVLVYPVPELGSWPGEVILRKMPSAYLEDNQLAKKWLTDNRYSVSYETYQQRNRDVFRLYDQIGESENLIRVYPHKLFCETEIEKRCFGHDSDHIYYFDSNHLSVFGAEKLADDILKKMKEKWL